MTPTDNLYYDWPLVTLIINGHEPQWVEDTLVRVRELSEDARVVLVAYMVLIARGEVVEN